jgi:orotate phosphoribosyltransferase
MFQPKFETEAFQTTYKDFEKLIDKLKENIKNHKYDVVIGDDCSARLVTLVVSELIKKIYKKDGAIPPKTLFIAGNRREYQIEEYMEKLNKYLDYLIDQGEIKKNAKVLFVSEFLSSGKSASNVIGALIGKGFDVDFGLLSAITHEEKVVERLKENLPKENLYLGTDFNRDGLDAFYDKSPIQGV